MRSIIRKTRRLVAAWLMLLPVLAFGSGPYTLTNEWTLGIGSISDSSPAVGPDGAIFFGAWDGHLWAVNPDGSRKWVFAAGREVKSSPAIGRDGTVYFGSRDWKLYAVAADGNERWEFKTGGWVDCSPAIGTDGTIYFGSWDKRFYALNPDGVERWKFPTGGPIMSSPSIGTDGAIFFGSDDGKLYALRPDGAKKWDFGTGGAILSSPAINGEHCLYFTSVDGCLYAVNLDGTLRWRLRTGGITESSPVIGADGSVYVGVNDDLWKVSPEGKKVWERPGGGGGVNGSALILKDGSLCFISPYALLIGIDSSRNYLWDYYLYGYGHASPAVGPLGTIYLPGWVSGVISMVALRGPATLATTPWPKFRGNSRNTGNAADGRR
jgi:PQQ-like domain